MTRIVLLLISIASSLFFAGCMDLQPLPNEVEAEMQKAVDRGFDGMIIYVNQAGKSSFYSAGWKDREAQIPADPHDLFKIASISKLYMAAAASKLVAQGDLNLDHTLSELIPEVSDRVTNANKITLAMMIRHRSGIPDYIYESGFPDHDPDESYMTTAELIFDKSAEFDPDKKYAYSNSNYLFLGEILDRTIGYSHHQYISEEILVPLGLSNTYSLAIEVDSNELMSGYYKGYDPDLKSERHTRPGGSMVATAEDVGIFLRALVDGTLLTPEEQEIYSSVYEYEHTGWIGGYTSIARYHGDIDAVVVQFVNTSRKEIFWLELERVYGRIVRIIEKNE